MDRVIITGGNGFIGRHLVKKLLACNLNSVIIISKTSKFHDRYLGDKKLADDAPLTVHNADIKDRETMLDIFKDERADTCIHLAAKMSVAESIKNPDETITTNVNGTLNVLEACHNSNVTNFVFTSSAAVYGDVKKLPISESQILEPISPYGKSKMLAEKHVLSYQESNKIKNAVSLRIFNVYGDVQQAEHDIISKFAKTLSNGLPPVLYGKGKQTRDFISVDDVVDAILLSIRSMENKENNIKYDKSSTPIFNIGTGVPTSIEQLAKKMIQIFGLDLHPIYKEGREDERVISNSYADMTKARKILRFVPKKEIDEGLREIIGTMLIRK